MSSLQQKSVIVTGGAGGIGRGIVQHLLRQGASVLVVDIVEQEQGEAVLASLDGHERAAYLCQDIALPESAEIIVQAAVEQFGALHGLVNNAHASRQAPILETTREMWELSLGTGLFATFNLMRAAWPELKRTRGSIVNFASGAGLKGQPTQATYAAAKEAIRGLSRVAANEWAADGIRVNLVSPIALTPGIEEWAKADPEQYQQVLTGIPLGRLGDPEHDIAPVVAFLLSDAAAYMTGQTLMADGGSIMLR